MSTEYTKLSAKYNQLSSEERGKIEAYYEEIGISIAQIARNLRRSKSTICEEIRRGKYKGKYRAHIAQNRARKRRKESHKHTKWRNIELLRFIEKHLKLRWSPEIISHELSKNGLKFSHMSIYTLIRKHRPEWRKLLPRKGKKLRYFVSNIGMQGRTNVSKHPKIVELRKRFGDFEVDTVLSCRGGKSCLAVFVERQSRKYFITKMKDKSA